MAKKTAKAGSVVRTFEGNSKAGKLQKALNSALKELNKALGEDGVSDASATWSVDSISGVAGGMAPSSKITVAIKATRQPAWKS